MNVHDFFQAVIPWEGDGTCSIHWLENGKFSGQNVLDPVDLLVQAARLVKLHPRANFYFCLSRHLPRARDHDTALALCSAFLDVDFEPGNPNKYQTLVEAVTAVFDFCQAVGLLPPSAMVVTGGGLHVYWFSDRILPVAEWQPFADALKTAARTWGLKADLGVTGDRARVLRLPKTNNYKYGTPRKVELAPSGTGTKHDFRQVFGHLVKPQPKLAEAFKTIDPKSNAALKAGIDGSGPPIDWDTVVAGCPWLAHVQDTAGQDQSEPLWHDMLRCLTYLDEKEGEELAHALSRGHAEYDERRTQVKWERAIADTESKNLGYPSCAKISDNGATQCKGCPHLQKGKSPLNLGLPGPASVTNGIRPENYPPGFFLDRKTGYLMADVVDKNGASVGAVTVMTTAPHSPKLHFRDGVYGIGFICQTERDTEKPIYIAGPDMHNPQGVCAKLTGQGAVIVGSTKGKIVSQFTTSWLDKMRQEANSVSDPNSMGWRYGDGGERLAFVYNDKMFHTDGRITPVTAFGDDEFRRWYQPTGQLEPWFAAANLLTRRKRPELDVLIAIGFAAPLMTFTGNLYGGVVSCFGDPGSSKSCGQQVAAAVWGNPKQTRESLGSTQKSVLNRLGRIKSLAAYWDDIQTEVHQEHLYNTMFVSAQGAEGGRLNPDASYKERKDWQSMLVACSNISFVEYLVKTHKSTTAGLRRVLEFEFKKHPYEPGMIDELDATRIFGALEHNYGRMGELYAKLLATEHAAIEQLLTNTIRRFKGNVKGKAEEAYWWGMCGCLIVGAALANMLGARLDVNRMEMFLTNVFLKNREQRENEGTEGGSESNTENSLVMFINETIGGSRALYTDISHRRDGPKQKINVLAHPIPGRTCSIQVVRDEQIILISKRALREFLENKNVAFKQVYDGMKEWYGAKERKLMLGNNTGWGYGQEMCLELPVAQGGILEAVLYAHGEPKARNVRLISGF